MLPAVAIQQRQLSDIKIEGIPSIGLILSEMRLAFFFLLFGIILGTPIVAQWVEQSADSTFYNNDVFFTNPDTGYVVSMFGVIQKTFDGGQTWDTFYIATEANWVYSPPWNFHLFSVHFPNDSVGYIGGKEGALFKTIDYGHHWTEIPELPTNFFDISALHFFDSQNGYATTNSGAFFFKTTDGAFSWEYQMTSEIHAMYFTDPGQGIVVGEGAHITVDSAITWSQTSTYSNYRSVDAINGDLLLAVGNNGTIARSIDNGVSWTDIATPYNYNLSAVELVDSYSDSSTIAFEAYTAGETAGNSGVLLKSIDGGLTWLEEFTTSNVLQSIHFPNPHIGYVVGWNGTILKYNGNTTVGQNDPSAQDIKLYPNPASDFIQIQILSFDSGPVSVKIWNSTGKSVLSCNQVKETFGLNISQLTPGIYTCTITDTEGFKSIRFVKI